MNRNIIAFITFITMTCVLLLNAHGDNVNEPWSGFYFDNADLTVETTLLGGPLEYDGDVVFLENELWYTWLEFVPGKGDVIWTGVRVGSNWKNKQCVISENGEYSLPTLTADTNGQLWLSYESRHGNQWDIWLVRLEDGIPVTDPVKVSTGSGTDINHKTAVTEEGVWIVWQSDRGGRFEIVARVFNNDFVGKLQIVSDNSGGNWHPSITSDMNGNIYIVWDWYDGNAFNVNLRVFRAGNWEETFAVTNSPAFEGRADIVSDHQNRIWVVWEEGGQNWGKPFRGINMQDHKGPLHRFRLIRMALLSLDGSLQIMEDQLPMPSVDMARKRNGLPPGVEKTGVFYERSRFCVDSLGRLWVFYRHYYAPGYRLFAEEGWGIYARCYTDDGWSKLMQMEIRQGDGMQRLELTSNDTGGISAVWSTGRTTRFPNNRPRGLVSAQVDTNGWSAIELPLKRVDRKEIRKKTMLDRNSKSVKIGGKTYHLFYGDLHRHTDFSLCCVTFDGTLDDAYRYAIEVAKLDFLGITDHTHDIAQGDPLSQLWWRNRKAVYRHQLIDGEEMRFIPFYAYEWSRQRDNIADYNVISLRGDMLRPFTLPLQQFWSELGNDTITIPHQPFRRDTWQYQDDKLRPLAEIFQGGRDNSTEKSVHQGLQKGYHLGFIASSDHISTSASYAGVWAENSSRESIFRALQARRTFAATDKIWLMFKSDTHCMGEITTPENESQLSLKVLGTAPIQSINLIVDGETYKTWSPNNESVEIDINLGLSSKRYAYFHLIQTDGNEAWSSPIWFDGDGEGDTDSDGIDDFNDNCPENCNTQQLDFDNDTIGDVCDPEPGRGCEGCGATQCEQEC